MPNHVHVVVHPRTGFDLPDILHSWKSFAANKINQLLKRKGTLWQPEYYDHLVRDEEDLCHAIQYVLANPVAAGIEDWEWFLRGTAFQAVKDHGQDARATFRAFAEAGKKLAELHLDYEKLEPWPLQWLYAKDTPLSYRVEKMKLNKEKTVLWVNDSLSLAGIPPEVFEYRLGNRSALDWVIDQYQVSEDKRSGIRSDPNRPDDPEYIVRLVGQVVRVSVETVKIVNSLPRSYE